MASPANVPSGGADGIAGELVRPARIQSIDLLRGIIGVARGKAEATQQAPDESVVFPDECDEARLGDRWGAWRNFTRIAVA